VPHHSLREFAGARVSKWNDIAGKAVAPLEARASELEDAVDAVQLGEIYLYSLRASASKVVRLGQLAPSGHGRRYLIHRQLQGATIVRHVGREVRLSLGDLVMCDSSLPCALEFEEAGSVLVLSAPPGGVKQRLPAPEFVLGKKLDGDSGLSSTLSLVILSVWRDVQQGVSDDVARRLGTMLLDLVATSCMDKFGERVADGAIGSARRSHVRCHIESNLKDPNLTVSSIAQTFRISPRYLHMLFADEDETLCEYIRRRRLEECKKQLSDPMWMRHSISELAYAWGFNNTTHFARVFRDQYGVSPRDHRTASVVANRGI
jgi:AraC-like DNA-binding protein